MGRVMAAVREMKRRRSKLVASLWNFLEFGRDMSSNFSVVNLNVNTVEREPRRNAVNE